MSDTGCRALGSYDRRMAEMIEYDEFGLFDENIAEFDLRVEQPPAVERVETPMSSDATRSVSALKWGSEPPEVVFVHGGAQNAHTWDTVILALGRPSIAIDLPGHGHSGWRSDGAYTPMNLADDIAEVIIAHAPNARLVVGMSLGGLTSMELAVRHPELVRRLVMVDITPGVNQQKAKAIIDFVDGPQDFASYQDLLDRTMQFNPSRSEPSLRRGILHNAVQQPDRSWQWRYDRSSHARSRDAEPAAVATDPDAVDPTQTVMSPLWDHFEAVRAPIALVRGSTSPVVDDEDVAEAIRRQPDIDVRVVDGAGHSVQGDRPVELASVLAQLLV
ncbi:MAG: pimeloyl-ACP methyl ester carboxylesterase [Candidatus Aldehydirespiratoraceae bacterium]|jgi:pimeloyl-ACP methyl ester carboxylesterase